ncbi:MAG TPA: methylated-DNA--[protein]-cysteine S-methyltransferase [Bacillota bacterium]|nr:methylated-DNA--[protein]-cysteine S-methyltransferase [Bacillota bacterium]
MVAKPESFFKKVYELVAVVPKGKVVTYGEIAAALGSPQGARTVGWAMRAAPEGLGLPCHRVVNRQGKLAPEPVFGGRNIQRMMLEAEGVTFLEDGRIDMEKHRWQFEKPLMKGRKND